MTMFALALACGAAVVSARAVVEVDAKGGYGNQLFEFASCRALALRGGAAGLSCGLAARDGQKRASRVHTGLWRTGRPSAVQVNCFF